VQRAGIISEDSMSGRTELASERSTAVRMLEPMTPERARLPVSAAPWETESVRDVVFGSCRVFKGNLEYLVGTARYGPVRRVVWDPWLAEVVLSQSRGPDSARHCCRDPFTLPFQYST